MYCRREGTKEGETKRERGGERVRERERERERETTCMYVDVLDPSAQPEILHEYVQTNSVI